MDLVIGGTPLALLLAEELASRGPTTLVSERSTEGPFLWRRGSTSSGEGAAPALRQARRTFLVLEPGVSTAGLFTVLKPGAIGRGVVVLPGSMEEPDGAQRLTEWSRIRVPVTWGPTDPWISAWATQLARGQRLWVPRTGAVHTAPGADVIAAVLAVADRVQARWTVGSTPTTLEDLARALAEGLGRPLRATATPLALAAWKVGLSGAHVRAWLASPALDRDVTGWSPPTSAGVAGWLGDPDRFKAA